MENIQTGSENLRFSVGKHDPLIMQGVIINIQATLVNYENVNTYT